MELLNRDLQRRILTELAEIYPSDAAVQRSFRDVDERQVGYNLFYLHQHGLVDIHYTKMLDGSVPIHTATINARGIDFISNDGGLSAVLGVVTVKLHEDTLKALLIGKIGAASGDPTTKKLLIEKIKGMPAEALSTITERALESGLDQLPDLLGSLSKWLGL
ncbi:UNVERIFIED_ORG: hypothetical protein J2W19_003129 [Shinella zoogloeoides]|nr:hypothetical protein [Shinella zoogloeoides]